MFEKYQKTANALEEFIEEKLFDPSGIMYSGIDGFTGKPFDPEFITPLKAPGRAAFDPWSYCSYEDSIMTSGFYIEAMVLKYELTGDSLYLERAGKVWQTVKNIYSCSQVNGIGSFLRPYGGYDKMFAFAEPLGTDQSSPLFSALFRYKKHVCDSEKGDIERIMLQWLDWYVDQNFEYFYYKSFIAKWNPAADKTLEHAASYFLPALAWAFRKTGKNKYREPLEKALNGLKEERFNLAKCFIWASDLIILKEIMGGKFSEFFTQDVMEAGEKRNNYILSGYSEPGDRTLMRQFPESAKPEFKPYIDPKKDPGNYNKNKLRYARPATVHAGRLWPRQEVDIYIALAGIGYNKKEMLKKAFSLLSERKNVPMDFTHYVPEDYELIPESAHLFARYVGVILVECLRNYWLIKHIQKF